VIFDEKPTLPMLKFAKKMDFEAWVPHDSCKESYRKPAQQESSWGPDVK